MDDAPEDERTIELSTIAAIYPELIVDDKHSYTATLELAVTPVEPLKIVFQTAAQSAPPALPTPPDSQDEEKDDVQIRPTVQQVAPVEVSELSHLPPLTLRISLPMDYPATKPPIVSISVNPPWLSRTTLDRLKDECARLWEEVGKDQVVYAYIDYLQQESEQAFGLAGETNASLSSDLKLALLDFDLSTKRESFERGTFDCGICLEPKKGTNCHKLMDCGHVFCVACLQDFYRNCITEGDVDSVKCIDPGCGKDEPARLDTDDRPRKRRKQDRTLNPSELLQIPIEHEQVQRYVRLKRKKRLEADKNTAYCPRQWCQAPARNKKHPKPSDMMDDSYDDEGSDEESETAKKANEASPMAERLHVCEDCNYAFCNRCKKSWHGEYMYCSPPRGSDELTEEEAATLAYLEKHSTPCPTCSAPSQKIHGCNHMVCFKCKTHFCYLCSAWLVPSNPYAHFNTEGRGCYQRLWELEEGDGEGIDRPAFYQNPQNQYWRAGGAAPDQNGEEGQEEEGAAEGELPPEDFDAFGGDPPLPLMDEEDNEDEAPARDQPRNRNVVIEIVNFANQGAQNARRIELPERPRVEAVPAQAPVPPGQGQRRRRRGGGQQPNRGHAMGQEPRANNAQARPRAPAGNPAVRPPQEIQPPQAPLHVPIDDNNGHANEGDGPPPPPPPYGNPLPGLERFLQLAQNDQEDEWDSDELDEDDEDIRGMDFGHVRRGERARMMGWRR